MQMSDDALVFPDLSEPYAAALRAATSFIQTHYQPTGILVTGTIIRGNPHPASDLDIVVSHPHHWRQRVQRRFNTVPAEMFINPPFELERGMERDRASGRPVMAHMLATGVILVDIDGEMARLQRLARETLAAGPSCPPEQLTLHRYGIATLFEDATDIATSDPELAAAFVSDAVLSAMRLMFLRDGEWLPRHKLLLAEFEQRYPDWGSVVRAALRAQSIAERLDLSAPLIRHATGATGFFEWESTPQSLDP